MAAEAVPRSSLSPAPKLAGNRDVLTMEERERSLDEAIQWLRDELIETQVKVWENNTSRWLAEQEMVIVGAEPEGRSSLKSQDQSLMRQFLALRSQINTLKDHPPLSIDRSSSISIRSPKPSDDEDVFFANDPRVRFYSDTSFRAKSYSSGSEDEKL